MTKELSLIFKQIDITCFYKAISVILKMHTAVGGAKEAYLKYSFHMGISVWSLKE